QNMHEMEQRCLFLENPKGEVIGTTTAWYGNLTRDSKICGRIHWVAILPEYQGKQLSKPLLSEAMNRLSQYHNQAFLTSQTTSYQSVNICLNNMLRRMHSNNKEYVGLTLI